MKYKQFGNTGLLVSEVCFGTMTFGGRGFYEVIGRQGQEAADRLVSLALDAGVNFFDTANAYSEGQSEKLLGKALGSRRAEVVVATKVHGRMHPHPNGVGLSRLHIMEQVDASLRRLGTDYIDLYQVHGVDQLTPFDETLRALEDVVRAGKVRYVGCSNMAAWQIMKALYISGSNAWIRFESFQGHYALVARDIEREIVPLLRDQRLALMVWSPLAGGLLTDKFHQARGVETEPKDARRSKVDFPPVNRERLPKVLEALHQVAADRSATMAQVALAWLLHQPVVTSVIVGAKRPEQLAENLAATDIRLSEADLELLDASSALPPEYPGWMIAQQAGDRLPPGV